MAKESEESKPAEWERGEPSFDLGMRQWTIRATRNTVTLTGTGPTPEAARSHLNSQIRERAD